MQRSFYVGDTLTETDVKAKFEDGVLKLSIPKKEAEKLEKNKKLSKDEKKKLIDKLTADMKRAAKDLDFETAAFIRDKIRRLM